MTIMVKISKNLIIYVKTGDIMDDFFICIAYICVGMFILAMSIVWIKDSIADALDRKVKRRQLKEEELIKTNDANNELEKYKKENEELKDLILRYQDFEKAMSCPITWHLDGPYSEEYSNAAWDERWDKATSGEIVIKRLFIETQGVTAEDITPNNIRIKEMHAEIYSKQSGKTYTTYLDRCSCDSYKYAPKANRPYVCKHMLTLAAETDALPFLKK